MSRTLTAAGRLILLGTILVAGWHTVYYLYNWQWVRAQIAGIAFVATLVIGATWFLLARVDRLQRDIDRSLAELEAAVAGQHSTTGAAPNLILRAQPDFAWLDPAFGPPHRQSLLIPATAVALTAGSPRTSVFIPILLGAGVVLSIVAGLVERTAATVHSPSETGAEPGRTPDRAATGPAGRPRWFDLIARGALVLVLVVGGTLSIYQTAHYRPESLGAGTTELTVQVSAKGQPHPPGEAVEIMARYCARTAIADVSVERVEPVTANTALLVVSPLLDDEAQRRYGGCLQDASLNRHQLTVTRAVLVPAGPEP
jgi:hypothetical protein